MQNSCVNENVVAIYKYEKTSDEDLQFERGEHLTILKILTDGNWALAKNGFGKTGLIPLNFVEPASPPPWLFGKISRDETESLLQNEPSGSFLVRGSGRFAGDYTLSVVSHDTVDSSDSLVQHYHINSISGDDPGDTSRFFSLDNKDIFPSLRKLVEHYKVGDKGLAHPLTSPVVDTERMRLRCLRERHWIPRERLVFGQKLGHGEFGEVLKAQIGDREVAVKRYKATARRQLVYEAYIMSLLEHENLLPLIGVTEEEPVTSEPGCDGTFCLVTEFSPLGSLLAYLRSRGRVLLSVEVLLNFATDVAQGLAYMESHAFLHCDVAARNVLLFPASHQRLVAKLGDFGLAIRSAPSSSSANGGNYNGGRRPDEAHRVANATRIPIKWTAPESIRTRVFTHKSDVWSYGVFLWEVFSYGRLPYPRLLSKTIGQRSLDELIHTILTLMQLHFAQMTNQVLAYLEEGGRMEAPQDCPTSVYGVMLETWAAQPARRPTFEALLRRLSDRRALQLDRVVSSSVVGGVAGAGVPPVTTAAAAAASNPDSAYDTIFDYDASEKVETEMESVV